MKEICFPENITDILRRLEGSGYEAYAVGGCIRDSLLGRTPDDWDVTTSARPGETMAVFGEAALPTGLKHGTVTVRTGAGSVEVTTFRTEGAYSDHRRPDSVCFVNSLTEDLARRDFTVNAMAMGLNGKLADPFGGQRDLEEKVIRCVGQAEWRFQEDALRMYRALRFSAKLGFTIDPDTLAALYANAPLAAGLAPERVETELGKLLTAPCAQALEHLFASGLMRRFCPVESAAFSRLEALPPERELRLAGLCALLRTQGLASTEDFLKALRCSTDTVRHCAAGAEAALAGLPQDRPGWKKLLYRLGYDSCRCAAAAALALGQTVELGTPEAIAASGECWTLGALAVKGGDLRALGYSGRALGAALETLLFHVMEHPEDNEKERLLALL